jgi:hypothetical protein
MLEDSMAHLLSLQTAHTHMRYPRSSINREEKIVLYMFQPGIDNPGEVER